MELEADDNSDLSVTSMRVVAGMGSDGSTRFDRYVGKVKVYMGDKEVGSMDASDFSRNNATSTGTISLDNAIIKKGMKERFYVAFVANDVIDTVDQDNTIDVSVDRVRFEDATGVTLTDSSLEGDSVTVDFEDATSNDEVKVQSDSSTPDATILKVDANSTSDEFNVFSFKIKTGSDSSDVDILSLPITLSIHNSSSTLAINTEDLIDDMHVEIGGKTYESYTVTNPSIATSATEDAVFTFDIDQGDLTINGDTTEQAKVFVKFGRQDGKYKSSGTTVTGSVVGANIDAENSNGDNVDITGTVTGKSQTAAIAAADVGDFTWTVGSTGTYIDFFFTVTASDEDFTVLKSSIASTTAGTATTSAGVLSKVSGDAVTNSAGVSYTVNSGDTATFRVEYSVDGTNGETSEVTLTSVAGQEVPDAKQLSPKAVLNVQS